MSYYADYVKERMGDEIIENDVGFVTYRYLNEGKSVYIVDLYIRPDFRREHEASSLADQVVKIAKAKGAIELLGTVNTNAKNATQSMDVLIGYGMKFFSSTAEMLVFKKEV